VSRIGLNAVARFLCMGIAKKAAAFGIAKKVYDEARKPHNQAKIKEAARKLQEKRRGKRV
jgi:hypothetical protein